MWTLLADYRVEVPALRSASMRWNSARFEDQPGPTSWYPAKDQSLRTEWAYIRRFARRWRSCPPCPGPCLRRGHRSLPGSPPPASWCLSAFCCPPVAPNPCLHPRRLLPLPLFGQSSVSRCSAERCGDACPRPGRRCAASSWIVVSSIAPCRRLIPLGRSFLAGFINEVLAKGNVAGNASLRPVESNTLLVNPRHY